MLRLGDRIRLTSHEKVTLSLVAGSNVNPTSVPEYNAIIMRAKSDLNALAADTEPDLDDEGIDYSGHAEARLLSALSDGLLVVD